MGSKFWNPSRVSCQLPDCRVARDRFAPLVEAALFIHETLYFRRKQGGPWILEVMKIPHGRELDVIWDMQGLLRSGRMTAAAAHARQKSGRADPLHTGFFVPYPKMRRWMLCPLL